MLGPDQTQLCHNTRDTRVCHVYRVTCLEPDMSGRRTGTVGLGCVWPNQQLWGKLSEFWSVEE